MSTLTLLKWELHKIVRRRSSYIGFVLVVLFCVAVMIGFGYSKWKGLRRHSIGFIDPTAYINAKFYANFILNISFFSLLPLFAAVLYGSQLAGEAKDGTLRTLLVRPISRPKLFAVKALVAFTWMQVIVIFMMVFALVFGTVVIGGGELMVFIWEYRKAGPWIASGSDWIWIFGLSALGAGVSLLMVGAFAMMLSAITDNPVVAHVGTLGTFFISTIIQRLPGQMISPEFKKMMPTSHMNFWHELSHLFHPDPNRFDAARFWTDTAWCMGYIALFLGIDLAVFSRKDIHS